MAEQEAGEWDADAADAAAEAEAEAAVDAAEVDLRSPIWTHELLVAAAARTLHGRDPLASLLRPEDARPAVRAKQAGGRKAASGAGAPAAPARTGRLLLEAVAGDARRGETDDSHAFLCALAVFLGPAAEGVRLPLFLGRDVDLHALFTAVAAFGGAAGVAGCKRAWSAVSDLLHGPVRAPTKAAVHRAAYVALLGAYEAHLTASGEYAALVEAAKLAYPAAEAELALRPAEPGAAAAAKRTKRGAVETRACKACGDVEAAGRLLPCDFCGAAFHLACLGLDAFPQARFWKCAQCAELDPNDDWCALCGEEGDLLCCDACPRSFHAVCLGLPQLPPDDAKWLCNDCQSGGDGDDAPLEVAVAPVLHQAAPAAQPAAPADSEPLSIS